MNRSLAAKHDKGLRQRREAGRIEGTKFQKDVTTRQLYLREVTAFVVRRIEPLPNPKAETDEVVYVPYMPKRPVRKLTPAQAAMVFVGPELIKRR